MNEDKEGTAMCWSYHVKTNSLEKFIMLGMAGGTRKRGKPRVHWLDDINCIATCTLGELNGSGRDQDTWTKKILIIINSRMQRDGTR